MEEPKPPSTYYIDESDPDILMLRRQDGTFVAAFSAHGATREGIVEAAMADYKTLDAREPAGEDEAPDARDSGAVPPAFPVHHSNSSLTASRCRPVESSCSRTSALQCFMR